jgi:hypothetical protein
MENAESDHKENGKMMLWPDLICYNTTAAQQIHGRTAC